MQTIRIYRARRLVTSFRPFFMSARQMADMQEQYPENRFLWLH